jgi:Ca-activated chloride channel family protein
VAIRLHGDVNGAPRDFVYEATFAEENADNPFIPRLWAMREVGFLLEQIRLHGEEKELKDEVLALSREYGIMTPYTSYLILESDADYEKHGIARKTVMRAGEREERVVAEALRPYPAKAADRAGTEVATAPAAVPLFEGNAADDAFTLRGLGAGGATDRDGDGLRFRAQSVRQAGARTFGAESGRDAVEHSKVIVDYKQAERVDEAVAPAVRHVGSKLFYLLDGVWTDRRFVEGMKEIRVLYASDEYFNLLDKHEHLREYFALGARVIVCLDDETAVIVEAAPNH